MPSPDKRSGHALCLRKGHAEAGLVTVLEVPEGESRNADHIMAKAPLELKLLRGTVTVEDIIR